jgi:hypothetical protein
VEPPTQAVREVLSRLPDARALPSENGALYYEVPSGTALPPVLRELVNVEAVTRFEAIEPSLHEIYIHTIGQA